jgi:hypothetical protein
MAKVSAKEKLWDAERLARFSNANLEAELRSFCRNHDDFFPRNFWNWSVKSPLETVRFLWAFQRVLQGAWQLGFPLEECVRLISCTAVPDRLTGATDAEPDMSSYPVWPYQRAVMLLGVEPWRARFCPRCGKRFVADKPARRFCSNRCSSGARRLSKTAWWTNKGQKWRVEYEKKKADTKGKSERLREKRR